VRHVTAYAAGMSEVQPRQFVLFAYSGACLWVAAFIGLGYFLGEQWKAVERDIDHYLAAGTIAATIMIVAYLVWWRLRRARGK
jgi:membrane protein DedA with SNARE-associated domain